MLPPGRRRATGAALLLLLLAGCGGGTAVEAGPVASSAPATSAAAAPAPPAPAPPAAPPAGALRPAATPAATPRPTPTASAPTTTAPAPASPPAPAGPAAAQVGEARLYGIGCDQTEAQVAASGAPRVRRGTTTIYAGAAQVSGDNQDPRVVRFDAGRRTWCRDDLERSGDDGRAYGLLWSGDVLVAVFSAVGTQGEPAGDLRRFTGSGWLTSYSDGSPLGGGGAKAAAVVRLDPATGAGVRGTWITADNNGKVNSVGVTGLAAAGGGVRVTVAAYYLPRGADRKPLTCTGSSPFTVAYTFDAAFRTVTALTPDPRCR